MGMSLDNIKYSSTVYLSV